MGSFWQIAPPVRLSLGHRALRGPAKLQNEATSRAKWQTRILAPPGAPDGHGRDGGFALEDAYCAGRLAAAALDSRKPRRGLNDAAIASLDLVRRYGDRWERPLSYSRAGRDLIRLGFRDDVLDAARLDAYPVLPHFHERRVTLASVPV